MKRLFLVLFGFAIFGAGCSKNSGPANGKSIQPNNKLDTLVSMAAVINNHIFQTDSAFGYNVKPIISDSTMDFNLLITGTQNKKDSLNTISLTINSFSGPGTYKINPPFVTATWYLNNQRHFANYGTIVVTSDTAYALVGTFMFLADSIFVNSGTFNVLMPY